MPKNILVIDDDEAILKCIELQLKNEDLLIDLESDPQAGIEKIFQNNYDLLLCDIRMQPLDGLEIFKKIKADKNNLPILFLTGYVDENIVEYVNKFDGTGLLIKPMGKTELIQSINNLMLINDDQDNSDDKLHY
ncbi:MAG: response regulator [Spirochaetes bacterium]|nr:response regulator [Spirochaetota bacterium]